MDSILAECDIKPMVKPFDCQARRLIFKYDSKQPYIDRAQLLTHFKSKTRKQQRGEYTSWNVTLEKGATYVYVEWGIPYRWRNPNIFNWSDIQPSVYVPNNTERFAADLKAQVKEDAIPDLYTLSTGEDGSVKIVLEQGTFTLDPIQGKEFIWSWNGEDIDTAYKIWYPRKGKYAVTVKLPDLDCIVNIKYLRNGMFCGVSLKLI